MSSSQKIKVAVMGASGYSGERLLSLLLGHPRVELVAATSRSLQGKTVGAVFPALQGVGVADSLALTDSTAARLVELGAEIAFLALPHGVSQEYTKSLFDAGLKVIDLSADFRLNEQALYEEVYGQKHLHPELLSSAVYGLPEHKAEEIAATSLLAAPGCYPTSILLPLIPLLEKKLLDTGSISVSSMSGVSGAGRKESVALLYAECNESVRPYSVPFHRHLSEIEQELAAAAGDDLRISFVPKLIPVTSGISTTIFASLAKGASPQEIEEGLSAAYANSPFVRLLGEDGCPDTKNVVGTNFIDIAWSYDARTGRVFLLSAIDNLGKGASSQAIQCMNLICGFPETSGLLPS